MMKKIRVYLRAFESDDCILLHNWHNNEEIGHYFSGIRIFS